PTALDFQAGLGWDVIRRRNRELSAHVRTRLASQAGLQPATPEHPALQSFLTAFRLPAGTDATALRRGLWEGYRAEPPVAERRDGLLTRVPTLSYNPFAEIDRLAEALQALLP